MFSVTLSMPKSQVFLVSALLSPADSLVTGFGAVQQLPEASASPTVCNMLRGTHNFTFCDKFRVRPELPILVPPGQVGDACSVPAGKSWGCQRSWSLLEQGQQWDTMTACVCVSVCVCAALSAALGGFVLLPALPVPVPADGSSWPGAELPPLQTYEGTGLTFNKSFFLKLFFLSRNASFPILYCRAKLSSPCLGKLHCSNGKRTFSPEQRLWGLTLHKRSKALALV